MKIVIDDKIPYINHALDNYAEVECLPAIAISKSKLVDCDAMIIRTRTRCDAELLEGTSVKFIASATIGYDHIDTSYCKSHGITWTNAPGCNSGSVMQYLAAALLYYAKQNNIILKDRVLGVIGVGNVGKKIVRLAEILEMQVLLNDPPRERNEGICGFLTIESIMKEADIISFHVPLNREGQDKTYHLADKDFFSKLNPGTVLINTSRGEVVDTQSLIQFLNEDKMSAAILDVWEDEPDINRELLLKTCIATPHIAGYSVDGKANGTKIAVRSLSQFFGLGLDKWEPKKIPAIENPVIFCNGKKKTFQEIVTELVMQTYPIQNEISWLRTHPEKFEQYRGDYPVRREFFAYTVKVENMSNNDMLRLKRLGFRIENR
jgi:erythronate-4-phosphate dehydrogenase